MEYPRDRIERFSLMMGGFHERRETLVGPAQAGDGIAPLTGKGMDELSRETGQRASTLSEWRDTFLESGLSGLTQRSSDPRVEAQGVNAEGYRELWPRLKLKGVMVCRERLSRLPRVHGLQVPHRQGTPEGPRVHDSTIIP